MHNFSDKCPNCYSRWSILFAYLSVQKRHSSLISSSLFSKGYRCRGCDRYLNFTNFRTFDLLFVIIFIGLFSIISMAAGGAMEVYFVFVYFFLAFAIWIFSIVNFAKVELITSD